MANQTKPMKYRLEKPLSGFPIGHIFKVDRSTDSVHFSHNETQASMTFPRGFLDAFRGWFSPIEERQTGLKI